MQARLIQIDRYDPRKDKDALKELFEDFIQNKTYFKSTWKQFEEELNKRVLDLQYRNAMVIAREDDNLIGWGTFTVFRDYLGNDRAIIHQIMTKKPDSFKKGIEELIIRELENYLINTIKINKYFIICPDSDGSLRSLLMKIGPKKSTHIWYEKEL